MSALSDAAKAAALDDALTYCRLALTAIDLGNVAEGSAILSGVVARLIDSGACDFMEEDA